MKFEVDVSGEDILNKDYKICVANEDSIIKGFKLNDELVSVLSSRFGQGKYKYKKSQKGKATFKVRIYCVIIHYLLKAISLENLSLFLCRDFNGREKEIRETLISLQSKIGADNKIREINFGKLSNDSNAHKYSYLMRKDVKNKMNTYVKISIDDIEGYLRK